MRAILGTLAVSLGFVSVAHGAGAALPRGVTEVTSVEGIREYRLANGLQVLLVPDASKPTTTVNMTYRVGSRHESYGETGMAHLLEHLLFKGSPKHPTVWAEFSRRGLRANGSTWLDRTNYFASFSANDENLKWYLEWQADAMVNSFISAKDLASEMTVVRNEMEMGENNPGRVLLQKGLATMYQWHNYGKSTIGARSDVENVEIERLQRFYRTYYQPDNATLIVAGRFDAARTLKWIADAFGAIPRPQRSLPALYTLDPVQDGERSVTVRRVGGVPLVYAMYHMPPGAHPDFAAVSLLDLVMADEPSGRLHRNLVEGGLAAGVFAFSQALADPGFAVYGAQLAPGQDLDKAREALLATLERVADEPITQDELERARRKWLKDWDLEFADPERVGVALSEAIAAGDWRLFFLLRDRVREVTLGDVQRVARERLLASNRTLATYVPTGQPQRAPAPERVDVAAMLRGYQGDPNVKEAEAFEATPRNIEARTVRFELPVGLKAALLPKGTRGGIVTARLDLRFGTLETLKGQEVTGEMLAALLDKGTTRLSRQAVQDELDRLRSEVSFSGDERGVSVWMTSRRAELPQVLALVGEMLRQPALGAEAFEEVRRQMLASVEAAGKEPGPLLDNEIARRLNPYPDGDVRRVLSFDERRAALQRLTLQQVREFHRRFYGASQAHFGAVGDLAVDEVRAALSRAFDGWASAAPYERIERPYQEVSPDRLRVVTPDKQNAVLRISQPWPVRELDSDYPALLLANYLLGQGGDSRLWSRVREAEGLSYDVHSSIQWNPWQPNSTWSARAIFAPQNREKVERAVREEIERVLREGFKPEELERGRRGYLSFRQLSRAQDGNLAAALADNLYLGRTFLVSQQVDEALSRVTLDEVNAALRKYLRPERLVIGVAGDFRE
ncbi:MAG TPA: pitrilysin family protein [Burkholderiaceae bacterium]|nr:pitrilysin family protein [Burkholderiaceae bacterium]